MSEMDVLYRVRQITKKTGLSEYFIRKGIRDGTIPVIKCGNRAKLSIAMLMDAIKPQTGK